MTEKKTLTRMDLLGLPEPEVKEIYIESLGGSIHVKKMGAADRDSYDWSMVEFEDQADGKVKVKRNIESRMLKYLVRVLCNAKGKRMFEDREYVELGKKLPETIRDMYDTTTKALGDDDDSQAAREKNSETGPESDSSSGSV